MKNVIRKLAVLPLLAVASAGLAACSDAAETASNNISKASDNFEINRRIVFFNGITDKYLLEIEGYCSITADSEDSQLEVICLVGKDEDGGYLFKKHFLGLSDNVTYFVEQTDASAADPFHYRVVYRPETIIPDIDFQTSGGNTSASGDDAADAASVTEGGEESASNPTGGATQDSTLDRDGDVTAPDDED
ncbi:MULTISPECIES: hypothetical protein [unclassified Actinomyces]|uniref:beta-sandwich lipoprotein n=1 Tax=unclassified Actinomyces TaxID=2609248 RepID=UPI00192A4EC9|nr:MULTISPECIES: hypothetical protein [unclassified Actinomyces]